jgi:hypothetical protein
MLGNYQYWYSSNYSTELWFLLVVWFVLCLLLGYRYSTLLFRR